MGAVIFAYLVGLLFFMNATAVTIFGLQIVNIVAGIWFVLMASIAGWQHFNRE